MLTVSLSVLRNKFYVLLKDMPCPNVPKNEGYEPVRNYFYFEEFTNFIRTVIIANIPHIPVTKITIS